MVDAEYKLEKNIKIAMLYLEDDDAVNAETFIKKAASLITGTKVLQLSDREVSLTGMPTLPWKSTSKLQAHCTPVILAHVYPLPRPPRSPLDPLFFSSPPPPQPPNHVAFAEKNCSCIQALDSSSTIQQAGRIQGKHGPLAIRNGHDDKQMQ